MTDTWIDVVDYYDGYLSGYFMRDGQLHHFFNNDPSAVVSTRDRTYDVRKINERMPDDTDDVIMWHPPGPVDFTITEAELHEMPVLEESWLDKLRKKNGAR